MRYINYDILNNYVMNNESRLLRPCEYAPFDFVTYNFDESSDYINLLTKEINVLKLNSNVKICMFNKYILNYPAFMFDMVEYSDLTNYLSTIYTGTNTFVYKSLIINQTRLDMIRVNQYEYIFYSNIHVFDSVSINCSYVKTNDNTVIAPLINYFKASTFYNNMLLRNGTYNCLFANCTVTKYNCSFDVAATYNIHVSTIGVNLSIRSLYIGGNVGYVPTMFLNCTVNSLYLTDSEFNGTTFGTATIKQYLYY